MTIDAEVDDRRPSDRINCRSRLLRFNDCRNEGGQIGAFVYRGLTPRAAM
jgi:hypothetical protein